MTKTTGVLICLLSVAAVAIAQGAAKWTITQGIVTPESAYVDEASTTSRAR
jgi:hypothetical protein